MQFSGANLLFSNFQGLYVFLGKFQHSSTSLQLDFTGYNSVSVYQYTPRSDPPSIMVNGGVIGKALFGEW